MIYKIQINKRVRNIMVYETVRKSGARQNIITKLFMKAINLRQPKEQKP
jgi:hypothetical protein